MSWSGISQMTNQPSLTSAWLMETILDKHPAMYPYAQLRNISTPADVSEALKDETAPLEQEFGLETLRPFYRLVWLVNTLPSIFTIQTQVASRDHKPLFDWARTQVAAQIILLSRNPLQQGDRSSVEAANADWLKLIGESAIKQKPNTAGWMISIGPTPVRLFRLRVPGAPYPYRNEDLVEVPGFGSIFRFYGCGNARSKAAERWKAAIQFVCQIIEDQQARGRLGTAQPYLHIEG